METFIITGAGSGLGRELSLLLSKRGFHILLTGRTEEKLLQVKEEILAQGGSADTKTFSVSSLHEAECAVKEICQNYHVTGLINNAGVGHFGPFVDFSEEQLQEMFETNTFGTMYMTKAILPFFEEKKKGKIMNIISTAGLRGKKNEAVYAASKFAVRGFTESLQKEYENSEILFTGVYMGGMATPFWENSNHIDDPSRLRPPSEIAEIIVHEMLQGKNEIIIENKKL